VVVDDDRIAARAIELLKSRRAGRLTFLPLNKIRGSGYSAGSTSAGSSSAALRRGEAPGPGVGPGGNPAGGGLVGRAVELVRHEPVYAEVFRYVFGDTLVFGDLSSARRELGRCRAVTLDGELLEKSGAMTGGSLQQRSGQLSFGSSPEGDEAEPLRRRLLELGESLVACRRREAELAQQLEAQRPTLLQRQQRRAALEAEYKAAARALAPQQQRQQQLAERLAALAAAIDVDGPRQGQLEAQIAPMLSRLAELEAAEAQAAGSGDVARWQGLQRELEGADAALSAARQQRDGLLAARRERSLALERCTTGLQALDGDERRHQLGKALRHRGLRARGLRLAHRRQGGLHLIVGIVDRRLADEAVLLERAVALQHLLDIAKLGLGLGHGGVTARGVGARRAGPADSGRGTD
jgi:chromosome segregation protein